MDRSSATNTTDNLLNIFLTPPSGKSPEAIRERLMYWIERANHPERYTYGDTSPLALINVRRKARQNLKRTVEQYPKAAAQYAAELQGEE